MGNEENLLLGDEKYVGPSYRNCHLGTDTIYSPNSVNGNFSEMGL